MRKLAILAVLALVLVPAAEAKRFVRAWAVGSDRAAVAMPLTLVWSNHRLGVPSQLSGGYVLVYTLMERGLSARPARFYPAVNALCGTWDVGAAPVAENCVLVPGEAARRVQALTLFQGDAPSLRRVMRGKAVLDAPSNYTVAIELAFARSDSSRPAARPARCSDVVARWSAGGRPARFCLSANGAWSGGRLHEYSPSVGAALLSALA